MKMTHQLTKVTDPKRASSFRNGILLLATSVFAASCTVAPPTMVHETVGPRGAVTGTENAGYLTVYSSTTWETGDDEGSKLVYTDYDVNLANGTPYTHVANGGEDPDRITLPVGAYTIVARSENSGMVSVPVEIETGQLTVLHLDQKRDSKNAFAGIDESHLVRLPNGQAIGIRAREGEPLSSGSVRMATRSKTHTLAMPDPRS